MVKSHFKKPPLKRYAFLLGNTDYQHLSRLHNPHNDVETVAAQLRGLGYNVVVYNNLDWGNTWMRLEDYFVAAGDCDAMVLYYCGHGVQLDGDNYIVPPDFDPSTPVYLGAEADMLSGLVRVQDIMRGMHKASARLIFLDACRDAGGLKQIRVQPPPEAAPAKVAAFNGPATRSLRSGLAKQRLRDYPQTFICYAADPGDVAEDGPPGGTSPFSGSVTSHIGIRGLDVFNMSQRVARDVRKKTEGRQTPWSNSNLTDDFAFHPTDDRPMWILGLLGALTGLLGAVLNFELFDLLGPNGLEPGTLMLRNVQKNHYLLLVPLLFGSVLGYGAYRWGRKQWHVAVLTCLFYAVVAAACRYWFAGYVNEGTIAELGKLSFQNFIGEFAEHKEMLLYAILASALAGAASVFAAAPFVRDMAKLSHIALGALSGMIAAFLFLVFLWLRPSMSGGGAATLLVALFMGWEAILGINAGWAYARPTNND